LVRIRQEAQKGYITNPRKKHSGISLDAFFLFIPFIKRVNNVKEVRQKKVPDTPPLVL
jgi:hypothetical protein